MTDYMAFWWAYVKVGAIIFLVSAIVFVIVIVISTIVQSIKDKRRKR